MRPLALAIPLALTMATLGLAWPGQADAPAVETPRQMPVAKATAPPVVDGKLDDACWSRAPWSEPFVDIEGARKPKPLHQTRVKMLWDDKALYIAARLEEPHLQGTLREHDSYIFHADNDFEVFIDPDGDGHDYGELELNALGTTWDLLLTKPYRNGGRALDSWEIKGLQVRTALEGTLNDPSDTDTAWTVEIAIPWRTFREIGGAEPPKLGDRWRINFSRVEWQWDESALKRGMYVKKEGKPESNWVWSPQGEINMHLPERWSSIVFVGPDQGDKPLTEDRTALPRLWLGRFHQNWLANPQADSGTPANPVPLPRDWVFQSLQKFQAGTNRGCVATLRHTDGTLLSIDQDGRITSGQVQK